MAPLLVSCRLVLWVACGLLPRARPSRGGSVPSTYHSGWAAVSLPLFFSGASLLFSSRGWWRLLLFLVDWSCGWLAVSYRRHARRAVALSLAPPTVGRRRCHRFFSVFSGVSLLFSSRDWLSVVGGSCHDHQEVRRPSGRSAYARPPPPFKLHSGLGKHPLHASTPSFLLVEEHSWLAATTGTPPPSLQTEARAVSLCPHRLQLRQWSQLKAEKRVLRGEV